MTRKKTKRVSQYQVGKGYAGLGKKELEQRKYQAKMLTKIAQSKATGFEHTIGQLEKGGYADIFGDKKWLAKQAAGYRKMQSTFDNQYNKLHTGGNVAGSKMKKFPKQQSKSKLRKKSGY
tara:strand:+ start:5044 stop:5403 length:360 start_codon:yes stop_codon:yes gene_type:complete